MMMTQQPQMRFVTAAPKKLRADSAWLMTNHPACCLIAWHSGVMRALTHPSCILWLLFGWRQQLLFDAVAALQGEYAKGYR
jgi:hypothetical protein